MYSLALPVLYAKKLNVFFENRQEIVEDSEPFVLDGLSDYKTREMLLEAYIHQHPERQSYQYLRESGSFPHGWVGEQTAIGLTQDTQTFYAKLQGYLQNPEPLFEVKLKLDNLEIQGVIPAIYQTCLLRYSLSKKLKVDKLIQYWLEYVCYCASIETPKPFILVSWLQDPYEIIPLSPKEAHRINPLG